MGVGGWGGQGGTTEWKHEKLPGWSELVSKFGSVTVGLVIQPQMRKEIGESVVRHRGTVDGLRITGPKRLKGIKEQIKEPKCSNIKPSVHKIFVYD
jgi:hypothetical protein